jgi:hypothetical protein
MANAWLLLAASRDRASREDMRRDGRRSNCSIGLIASLYRRSLGEGWVHPLKAEYRVSLVGAIGRRGYAAAPLKGMPKSGLPARPSTQS